ncbi:hypothetical protein SERLADRAFT_472279 [Serpula lacrymans var. lacrymans S7.9]|uniref:Uncharacterized protein n=1 Tax=Serpula lacrymans var. lacrymans (strain S7.9) TaxID=578457 RepID=F8P2D2_SERL9|nr:uncharacterized protein SERLADRAFT_472279 [Serpula lacrymans var. lacrymans S7.9]EGO23310.1 hypothetical protein SERLADRAFT_472279 [Serpula lacrymans var. lacrymans S7.9]
MEHADSAQQLMMSQAVDLVKRFQSEGNFSDLQRAMELHDNARRQCPDNDAPDHQSGRL